MSSEKYLLADIGNTRTKIKIGGEYIAFNNDDSWEELLDKKLEEEKPELLLYSSVNEVAESNLIKHAGKIVKKSQDVRSLLENNSPVKYKHIKGIGTDRILSMIGGSTIAEKPLISVDCGTAVTVNLLDQYMTCIGGVIFSGFFTQSSALKEKTNKLPKVDKIKNDSFIGKNTNDAINYGIINSIVGGICETISHAPFYCDPDIVITGGYGYLISERLKSHYPRVKYERYLILDGHEYLAYSFFPSVEKE